MAATGRILRFAEWVNRLIGHPLMFIAALIQTSIWTCAVLMTHFDPHGFWFLYSATAVSYVTQFTLTLVGLSAKDEAGRSADESHQALETLHAAVSVLTELVATVRADIASRDESIDDQLEEIHEDIQDFLEKRLSPRAPDKTDDRGDEEERDQGAGDSAGERDRDENDQQHDQDGDQDHQTAEIE